MTIAVYITRLLTLRIVASLLAVAALLQLFDLLNNARQLLSRGGAISDLFTYATLRLPTTLEQAVPIAVLVGALATMFALTRSNEIVALRSAGMTIYRIFLICAPTTVAAAAVHFILIDVVTPVSERHFVDWRTRFESAGEGSDEGKAIWLRSADAIMRISNIADGGRTLHGIKIVRLSDAGKITSWIDAELAQLTADGWMLSGARTTSIESGSIALQEQGYRRWPSTLDPASIVELTSPAESRSVTQLRQILQGVWAGDSSPSYYLTRLYRTYAFPLASILMLLLALPATYMSRRRGDAGRGLGLGFGLGMGYLITEGLLAALGSAGALPPLLAVWSAPALFALIGASVVLNHEE